MTNILQYCNIIVIMLILMNNDYNNNNKELLIQYISLQYVMKRLYNYNINISIR